jgi:hypothetical protein
MPTHDLMVLSAARRERDVLDIAGTVVIATPAAPFFHPLRHAHAPRADTKKDAPLDWGSVFS